MIRTSLFDCCSSGAMVLAGVVSLKATPLSPDVCLWKEDGMDVALPGSERLALMEVLLGVFKSGFVLDGDQLIVDAAEFLGSGPVSHADLGDVLDGDFCWTPSMLWLEQSGSTILLSTWASSS